MKYVKGLLALAATSYAVDLGHADEAAATLCPPTEGPPNVSPYGINGIYMEKDFDWSNVKANFDSAIAMGYNYFFVGFYMSLYGCNGGCHAWEAISKDDRTAILADVHAIGGKVMLSVGGPGESYEYVIQHQNQSAFSNAAIAYAKQWGYDGVDLACKLSGSGTIKSPWANNGSFVDMAKTFATAAKAGGFTPENIGLSAPAPYFASTLVEDSKTGEPQPELALTYLALPSNSGQDWYVNGPLVFLMFDEEDNYMQYTDVFYDNDYWDPYYGNFGYNSSIGQVMQDYQLDGKNMAVLKAIDENESSVRAGYVDSLTLGEWGCWAQGPRNNGRGLQWTGGFVGWTWNGKDTSLVSQFAQDIFYYNCNN